MSDPSPAKACPKCGAALPSAATSGLCPRCLMAEAMLPTQAAAEEAAAPANILTPAELAPHFPQLEILECLGRGGMGVVYQARQKLLNRIVALKLLAPERVKDPAFAGRFAHEAQALAALNHPNIVTVHEFGRSDGLYYLIMEFVDGVNLRQAMQAGRFTPEQALAIVPPVCEALQYAHEHGIVHRDIKPENLLLDKEGRVMIADFGIAKMLGKSGIGVPPVSAENTGGTPVPLSMPAGTPQYMAPEQKEHRVTDHRADIYSLGVVLYEMLTGERPKDNIVPPSKRVQVDIRIDEIVLRALEKAPELRFATAAEFRTQVEAAVAGAPAAEKTHGTGAATSRAFVPAPWRLKAVIGWFLLTGLWAAAEWALDHRLGYDLNLTVLNLLAGFGLMSRRKGWWWFAVIFNGIQLGFIVLGLLVLAFASGGTTLLGIVIGPLVSPDPSGTLAAVLGSLAALVQGVVQWTLIRLRAQGWFDDSIAPGAPAHWPLRYAAFACAILSGLIPTVFYWLAPWLVPGLSVEGRELITGFGLAFAVLAIGLGMKDAQSRLGAAAIIVGALNLCLALLFSIAATGREADASAKQFGAEAAWSPVAEKIVSLTDGACHGLDFESGTLFQAAKLSLRSVEDQLRVKGVDIYYDPKQGRWQSLDLMAIPEIAKLERFKVSTLTRMQWNPSLAATDFSAGPNRSNIFKTREGSLGAVEITEMADSPRRALVRYKLVTNALQVAVQDQTVELQSDGSARLRIVQSIPNLSSRMVDRSEFNAGNNFHLEKITDGKGWPVRIESKPSGAPARFHYDYILNEPVPPGGMLTTTSEGIAYGAATATQEPDVFEYRFDHAPGYEGVTQRIELHRLPAGAELIEKEPADLQEQQVGDHIELRLDRKIPRGGHLAVRYRYRLAKAGAQAAQSEPASFGPVIERVVDGAIDFDSGKLASIPESVTKPNDIAQDVVNAIAWMEREGRDAITEPSRSLQGVGMKVRDVDKDAWDHLTPEQLTTTLAAIRAAPWQDLAPVERTPVTLAFQTREGGKGILQILAFTDAGVKIRYKLAPPAPDKDHDRSGVIEGRDPSSVSGVTIVDGKDGVKNFEVHMNSDTPGMRTLILILLGWGALMIVAIGAGVAWLLQRRRQHDLSRGAFLASVALVGLGIIVLGAIGWAVISGYTVMLAMKNVVSRMETAGSQLAPPPGVRFGAVVERQLEGEEAIDFDSGTKAKMPELKTAREGLEGISERVATLATWMEQQKMDALFASDDFTAYGMKVKKLADEDWEKLSSAQLMESLQSIDSRAPPQVLLNPPGSEPGTYGFQTREGSMGILQISDPVPPPRGVKIRYKLVQASNASAVKIQYKIAPVTTTGVPAGTSQQASKRQRFEPKEGMAGETHWGMQEKPSDLNPNGWVMMAYLTLGGTAPFTLPGTTNECRLKLLKGDDHAVTVEIHDVVTNHTMTFDLLRDHPAQMTINGQGYRVLFPTTRVANDQPDTTSYAFVIVKPAEDATALGPLRHFVRMAAGPGSLSFEGQPTTWEQLPQLLEAVINRAETVLEFAVTTDNFTVAQVNELQTRAQALSRQFGFEYLSNIGVQPPESKGSAPAPREKPSGASTGDEESIPPHFGPVKEATLRVGEKAPCFLSLDSGLTMAKPEDPLNNIDNPSQFVSWLKSKDINAELLMIEGNIVLRFHDTYAYPRPKQRGMDEWDQVSAEEFSRKSDNGWMAALPEERNMDNYLKPAELPLTLALPGRGFLQVTEFSTNPPSAKLRYKRFLLLGRTAR